MQINTESETLILKRLESALANEDNDLLKIATYKLHEKFHTGYTFEYTKQLKSIFDYVFENPVFDEEIVLMLTSTIEEILNKKEEEKEPNITSVIDNILPSSNSFETNNSSITEPKQISDVIKQEKSIENAETKIIEISADMLPITDKEYTSDVHQHNFSQNAFSQNQVVENIEEENINQIKNVCIFFDEKYIKEQNKKYSDILNQESTIKESFSKLGQYISSIENDIGPIHKILSHIRDNSQHLHFISNTQNGKIVESFSKCDMLPNENFDFYPIRGLTKLFKCTKCDKSFLDTTNEMAIGKFCPNCENIMMPDIKDDYDIMELEKSMEALGNSNIWVLINPPDENNKIIIKMFDIASKFKKPEIIYLLTQDENKRMFYKQMFNSLNIKLKTDYTSMETFLNEFSRGGNCNTQQMQSI